jgi:sugar phosphate isomerase/epimerase
MKLGFVSAILPEFTFEQLFGYAGRIKMDCVEVACWPVGRAERRYAGVTHIDAATLDKAKAEEIESCLNENNVIISAIGYYPNPLDPQKEQREIFLEHLRKCIRAAALLGVNQMNTFIGRNPAASLSENMEEFKKVWPDIVKFAEDSGVKIGIENCPMFFTMDEWPGGKNLATTPAIWEEMFSAIDSECFGLNYDPSHLVWQQMDYIRPIYDFKDKIFHFHIKDVVFYRDKYEKCGPYAPPLAFHAPKLPGLGDIDWGRTISALYDIRYDKCAVIEIEDRAFEDSLEQKLKSIELSQKYMQNFICQG